MSSEHNKHHNEEEDSPRNEHHSHRRKYLDSEGQPLQFSLWCNERINNLPVETFIKVSKKCSSLVKANDLQGKIEYPIREDTLSAFLLACQLKQFKVTILNAFELLELSQEWGVKSLEKFVSKYIEEKKLKRPADKDHLAILISQMENENADVSADIANIARNFNEYLRDDRLAQLHPEHLFKIILQAESRRINKILYNQFVMKLFQSDPEKAVPLSLYLDFESLSPEEQETVFQTREMHESAMGYFIAEAISDSRDKAQSELTNCDTKCSKYLQEIRNSIIKQRQIAMAKVQDHFQSEVHSLENLIEKQQKQIDQLREVIDHQKKLNVQRRKEYSEQKVLAGLELEKQMTNVKNLEKMIADRNERISQLTAEGIKPIDEVAQPELVSIESKDRHRRELLQKGQNEWLKRYLDNYRDVKSYENNVGLQIDSLGHKILDTRACVAAKIINDQLKPDAFLRNIEHRFEVFNLKPLIWDLTPEHVRQAELRIEMLESKISKSCPKKSKKEEQ